MKIKRSLSVVALPLALALIASPASAKPPKQEPTTSKTGLGVQVSDNVATSVKDWHPELNAATQKAAPTTTTIGCTCGKPNTQTAATTTATNSYPAGQRVNRGKGSGTTGERAQEIPLSSIKP